MNYNINLASYPTERREKILSFLEPHEQAILILRFGCDNGGVSRMLAEVATIIGDGQTRESIRRIESRAIQILSSVGAFDSVKDKA
jgi:DNA-directed RNA polymerase sigma subunit (sigma70/sigma32)